MSTYQNQFPLLTEKLYFNTAATGPMHRDLLEWRRSHDQQYFEQGSRFRETQHDFMDSVRNAVGAFFSCPKERVALVPSFSHGFNVLLDGLAPGQKVLLLKGDYPSVNWPVEDRNLKVCYAEMDAHLEDNILNAVRAERPNILAISLVQYISGIKISLDFLRALKNEFPELLMLADGTQFCGTQAFDFEKSPIDVLGASSYKWMLGGYGNGFMLFKEEAIQKIHPKTIGFNTVHWQYPKESASFVGHFQPGHQDTLSYGSLKKSIEFLKGVGMQKVSERIQVLSRKAKATFEALGLLDEAIVSREQHSSIFTINGSDSLYDHLLNNGVVCSRKGTGIRFSFHFYNTEEELDRLTAILAEYLQD